MGAILFIPLVLLGGLELGLRFSGYGYPTNFFLTTMIDGREYYVPNDQFGYRFFPPSLARTPAPQRMAVTKPPNTYRIFVFGESAAMGDPDPSYGAWRYLQVLLRERFPGTEFEVICVAMTAIDSDVILPMARECARRDGDLWIIYMGNNEMVGPFGGGTVFGSRAAGVGLIRADLAIKTTRFGQLLDGLLQRWTAHSSTPKRWGGLGMFEHHELRPDDPDRRQAYENFQANLRDILRAGHEAGVPMILSTVGSNLKDCAPFASLHAAALKADELKQWDGNFQAGVALESAGDYRGALDCYVRAKAIDSEYAELPFRSGRCRLALTNVDEALRDFIMARDYDALAFRADTRINQIIRQAAAGPAVGGVRFLDAERLLAQDSPGTIPGNELFYEHVHLNFDGNYRLGRAFAEETARQLPKSIQAHDRGEWASAEACNRRLAVSDWDRERVWRNILNRISVPPYTAQATHNASIRWCEDRLQQLQAGAASQTEEEVGQLYRQAIARAPADSFLHQNYAQYLGAEGNLAAATEQAREVCRLLPQLAPEWNDIGRMLILQGQIEEGARSFSRALALRANYVPALIGLGQIRQNQQRTNEAAACYRRALRADPDCVEAFLNWGFLEHECGNLPQATFYYQQAARLQPQGPADYFSQAVAAAALGRHMDAIERFGIAVQLEPEFWQAHFLLGLELATAGKVREARAQFSEAIHRRPDFAGAHFQLGNMLAKQGELNQAVAQYQIALQLDPTNLRAQQSNETIEASIRRGPSGDLK